MTDVKRRATVADVLDKLPHRMVNDGRTAPRMLASAVCHTMRSQLSGVDDALATAIQYGLADIAHDAPSGGLATEVWITDEGMVFHGTLSGRDRALCPLAHTYDLFVPGAPPTARTTYVDTLLPAARNDTQTSIFAYHAADATDYCGIEADRVNALAWTQAQPDLDEPQDRVTGYVEASADGVRTYTRREMAYRFEQEHYGADVDERAVTYIHLRGEYELHRVLMSAGCAAQTDDREFIHFATVVRIADGPRAGELVDEIHWSVDGRA
jgi:hypothetical protein